MSGTRMAPSPAAAKYASRKVREFEATLQAGFHVFQLEEIHGDPAAFVDRFIRLVEPLAVDREGLLRFVDRNGGYH